MPIGVGLYGDIGHPLHEPLLKGDYPSAVLHAVTAFDPDAATRLAEGGVRVLPDLDSLLADPAVDLVSFCSPFKDEQGHQILAALNAGKHVYAEKPCCLSEEVLDEILRVAERRGKIFHEMGSGMLAQPYCTLRELVAAGTIGEVVQVLSQKSYPWADWRPGDERVDGGLTRQVGIYNVRFAEQVAGMKLTSLQIEETQLGNEHTDGECRRAVSMMMTFANGGVGSAVANYCCPAPPGWGGWGYEMLRIFGTKGFVDAVDNGRIGTLAVTGRCVEAIDFSAPGQDTFALFLREIETGERCFPLSLADELSPTRWVLRAKRATA